MEEGSTPINQSHGAPLLISLRPQRSHLQNWFLWLQQFFWERALQSSTTYTGEPKEIIEGLGGLESLSCPKWTLWICGFPKKIYIGWKCHLPGQILRWYRTHGSPWSRDWPSLNAISPRFDRMSWVHHSNCKGNHSEIHIAEKHSERPDFALSPRLKSLDCSTMWMTLTPICWRPSDQSKLRKKKKLLLQKGLWRCFRSSKTDRESTDLGTWGTKPWATATTSISCLTTWHNM